MEQYDEETIVIKYGGHAMGAENLAKAFARDIVLLEQTAINPVVVHGGGPQIATMLQRLGIQSEFAAGLRITDAATIEIVEMVLAGSINKQLGCYIHKAGGKAVRLCAKDGNNAIAEQVGDGYSGSAGEGRAKADRRWLRCRQREVEGRILQLRARAGPRRRRHQRRQDAARRAARIVHQSSHRHGDPQVMTRAAAQM